MRRAVIAIIAITAFSSLLLASCSDQPEPDPGADAPPTQPSSAATGTSPADSATATVAAPPVDRSNEDAIMRQWIEAKAQCHTDNGFPAVAMPDGGIQTDVAPGQDSDYLRMSDTCEVQVNAQLGPPPVDIPFTDEELSARYDLLLEQRSCLESAGYPVNEPSTRQTYIDKSRRVAAGDFSEESLPWDPLESLNDPTAQEQCPPPSGQDVAEHRNASNG